MQLTGRYSFVDRSIRYCCISLVWCKKLCAQWHNCTYGVGQASDEMKILEKSNITACRKFDHLGKAKKEKWENAGKKEGTVGIL